MGERWRSWTTSAKFKLYGGNGSGDFENVFKNLNKPKNLETNGSEENKLHVLELKEKRLLGFDENKNKAKHNVVN